MLAPAKSASCKECALYEAEQLTYDGYIAPDIMFVGRFPSSMEVRGPKLLFRSASNMIVRNIVEQTIAHMERHVKPTIGYCYAIACCPEIVNYKVDINILNNCRRKLLETLDRRKPRVIVALGTDACKSLGLANSLKSVRGQFQSMDYGYGAVTVVPTFNPFDVLKVPGLLGILKGDIRKAIFSITHGFSESEMELDTPTDFAAIMKALDEAETYLDAMWEKRPVPTLVTIDTETTSLTPWEPAERMIAVSVAYAPGKGLAFPWEHREAPLNAEELAAVAKRFVQVFGTDKVFIAMQNAKFDMQWMMYRYKLDLPLPKWDTMLVEHLLDEDKKGQYGLKTLTLDYFPSYGKYEKELQDILAAIKVQKGEQLKEEMAVYQQGIAEAFMQYWTELSAEQRYAMAAAWVNAGHTTIAHSKNIAELKTRTVKGETVLLKKCQHSVSMLVKKLPQTLLVELLQDKVGKAPDAEAIKAVTYEDAPIDVLLKYAAIDAVVTRKLVGEQAPKVAEDDERLVRVGQARKLALPVPSLTWVRETLTMPMCHLIAKMEYKGILFDREKAKKYIRVVDLGIEDMMDKMFAEVGYRFNPNSNDLPRLLYEEMKLPVIKETDSGMPSTDAETIKELYDQFDIPFIKNLLILRKLEKLRGTYLMSWLKRSASNGRIHAGFNQTGTATYRLSSSGPNLQNLMYFVKGIALQYIQTEFPDAEKEQLNIKELFVADPGYEFYDLDISNAEMRVLCAYSKDPTLIDVFANDKDMHCVTAAGIGEFTYDQLMEKKEDKDSPEYTVRQIGKKVDELAFSKAA